MGFENDCQMIANNAKLRLRCHSSRLGQVFKILENYEYDIYIDFYYINNEEFKEIYISKISQKNRRILYDQFDAIPEITVLY